MQIPCKQQKKSIKQVLYELMMKEVQKDERRKINMIILPLQFQRQWGGRNLKKITPQHKQKSENTIKFSPINCSQISHLNFKENEQKKLQYLLGLANNQSKQIQRENKTKTCQRQKSYSLNTTKPVNQLLPTIEKKHKFRSYKAASQELYNIEAFEGYNVDAQDMSFEIDEYVKQKSVHSMKWPEI